MVMDFGKNIHSFNHPFPLCHGLQIQFWEVPTTPLFTLRYYNLLSNVFLSSLLMSQPETHCIWFCTISHFPPLFNCFFQARTRSRIGSSESELVYFRFWFEFTFTFRQPVIVGNKSASVSSLISTQLFNPQQYTLNSKLRFSFSLLQSRNRHSFDQLPIIGNCYVIIK